MDRIEKQVTLKAAPAKVWKALADAKEFGTWFGCALDQAFEPGREVTGKITDPKGYEHVKWWMKIVEMVPEKRFSFHWHPYSTEPNTDYSSEKPTLVTFELEAVAGGTKLTLTESGFDGVPLARRAKAFEMNESGWAEQLKRIERYVSA